MPNEIFAYPPAAAARIAPADRVIDEQFSLCAAVLRPLFFASRKLEFRTDPIRKNMFVHCVYFWLRDDLSDAERSQFSDGVASLTTIETVRHGFIGRPASTKRPIIDRSYSTALVAVFDDKSAHDLYQDHPIHDEFRDTCSSLWTDVKIYDFETGA